MLAFITFVLQFSNITPTSMVLSKIFFYLFLFSFLICLFGGIFSLAPPIPGKPLLAI